MDEAKQVPPINGYKAALAAAIELLAEKNGLIKDLKRQVSELHRSNNAYVVAERARQEQERRQLINNLKAASPLT